MALFHTHAAKAPRWVAALWARRFAVGPDPAKASRPQRPACHSPSPPHCVRDADRHGDHLDRARQVRQADLSLSTRLSTLLDLSGPYSSGPYFIWALLSVGPDGSMLSPPPSPSVKWWLGNDQKRIANNRGLRNTSSWPSPTPSFGRFG